MSSLLLPPDEAWAPAHYTKPLTAYTRGEDVTDFAQLLMKNPKGITAGEPLTFTNWQSWLMNALFEEKENGFLRYRFALVGLPRKQGKSLVSSAIALEQLVNGVAGGEIYSAAGSREQASIVFKTAKDAVLASPILSKYIKVYNNALENPRTGSIYKALSADGNLAHGLNPSCSILDELHIWPSSATNDRGRELFEALLSGSGARNESIAIAITTAGSHKETLLGEQYEYGLKIANGEHKDDSTGMFWWEAPSDALPTDREAWYKANPNLAEGLLSEEYLESQLARAEAGSYAHFQRLHMNQWVHVGGEQFINPTWWKEAERDVIIPDGTDITIGFDGSISEDATAIIGCTMDGTLFTLGVWETDYKEEGWTVPRNEVHEVLESAFSRYNVKLLYADPYYWQSEIEEWHRKWPRFIERMPTNSIQRASEMCGSFIVDLSDGKIGHDGNPTLTRHALNAIAKDNGTFRKDKKGSSRKVDALMAAVLANAARNAYLEKENRKQNQRSIRSL